MKTKIYKSYAHFLKRKDKTINGVTKECAEYDINHMRDNITNTGCWNCRECRNCEDCIRCFNCEDCVDLTDAIDCDCNNQSWDY